MILKSRYLDPKIDLTFKKVFGEHENILKSFLNALLPLPKDCKIKDVTYLPAELVPETPFHKDSIVDVRCVDTEGRHFIVEMQMYWTAAFFERVLFNVCKTYSRQLLGSDDYATLQPVYSLNLVNDIRKDHVKGEFREDWCLKNNKGETSEALNMTFIELPAFHSANRAHEKIADLWLRFLTEINDTTEQAPQDLAEDAEVSQAIDILERVAYSDTELRRYEKMQDEMRIQRTTINGFIAEGRVEGRAEGRAEERMKIARNLKTIGMSLEEIQKALELTEQEVKQLIVNS